MGFVTSYQIEIQLEAYIEPMIYCLSTKWLINEVILCSPHIITIAICPKSRCVLLSGIRKFLTPKCHFWGASYIREIMVALQESVGEKRKTFTVILLGSMACKHEMYLM